MTAKSKSILIVGAGPAGLTAAVELRRRGFHPRIVDQASGHPAESRALAVHARTLSLMEASGVTDVLLDRGNRVTRFQISEQAKNREYSIANIDLASASPPYNFVLILPQADTERALAENLSNRGIQVEWATELSSLSLNGGNTSVIITGPCGEEELQPDIIIGADGAHSLVRKSIGATFHGNRRETPFSLADTEMGQPIDAQTLRIWFTPTGLVGRFPMSPTFVRYVATKRSLLENLPDGQSITRRVWETEFHVSFRHVDTFQKGNVFLAGDAAHIHSPVGGRGMNLGMEDAAWLAWLIDLGKESEYTRHRMPVAKYTLRQTKQQTAQVLNTGSAMRLIRRYLAPPILKIGPIYRRARRTLRALDTPPPPWLDE